MTTAVIFDFYGVVCADAYTAWQNQRFGPDDPIHQKFIDLANENDQGNLPLGEFYRRAATLAGVTPEQAMAELDDVMKIDEHVIDVIRLLREQGHKVGLFSNSPTSLYQAIDGFGIREHFDAILCSGEIGYVKPQLESYQAILKLLDTEPAHGIYIDDRQINVDGAKNAGMDGILFKHAGQLRDHLTERKILVSS